MRSVQSVLNTIYGRNNRNSKIGLEILGAAVGSARFVASWIQKRVQKIKNRLENLEYINDPQCALEILRSCWINQNWCIQCAAIDHQRKP